MSGFGQTDPVRKQAGVQESSGPVSGRTQPACYQFPTFRRGSVLPQTSRIKLCKTSPGSDFPHPFKFRFSKEGIGQTLQNQPGPDLDGLVRVWPNSSGLKASWCAGRTKLASCYFQTWLHSSTDVLDNIIQNNPRSDLALADCARIWPNGSGPEANAQESSGPLLALSLIHI